MSATLVDTKNAFRIAERIRAYLLEAHGFQPAQDVVAALTFEMTAAIARACDNRHTPAVAMVETIAAVMKEQMWRWTRADTRVLTMMAWLTLILVLVLVSLPFVYVASIWNEIGNWYRLRRVGVRYRIDWRFP